MKIDQLKNNELRMGFLGNKNIVIGEDAASQVSGGEKNVYIGNNVAANDAVSSNNTVIGSDAGNAGFGPFGKNVIIGSDAGMAVGGQNVLIGYESGKETGGVGNVFLGHQAGRNMGNLSRTFLVHTATSAGLNNPLIEGSFSTGRVRIGGDLEILPEGGLPLSGQTQGNSHLKMLDSDGNMDEIIRRSGTNNGVVMGDVDPNGGDFHLRADGITRFSVLADGSVKLRAMSSPPGTCNSSRAGQMYFDSDDQKMKACGRGGILNGFAWHNMF